MNIIKTILIAVALVNGLMAQGVLTPFKVKQSTTSSASILLEEAGANGTNVFGIKAADNIVSDIIFVSPSTDGTANQCLKTDGALTLGWTDCNGDIKQGGNSFSAAMIIGTNDNQSLYLEHNNVSLVELGAGGIDLAPVSVNGFYTKVKKLEVKDYTGGAGFYEYSAVATASASSHKLRDNAGSRVWEIFRTSLTLPVNYINIYSDLLPSERAIADGDAVDDSDPPSLGSASRPWYTIRGTTIYGNSAQIAAGLTVSGNITTGGNILPALAGVGTIGNVSYPYNHIYANGLTVNVGSPIVGQVWTATSTGGAGSWQTIDLEDVTDYDWSQTITDPGAAGTHTVTLTPGPLGVSAADTVSGYYLTGSPGAAEIVRSTGTGTCDGTGQASCTIQITTANNHTTSTTIGSASDGAQEAIMHKASGELVNLLFRASSGGFTWYDTVYTQDRSVAFNGEGWDGSGNGSVIGLATPNQKGISHQDGVLYINKLRIIGDGTTTGVYVKSSAANGSQTYIIQNWFQGHAISVQHRTTGDTYIERNLFRPSTICLDAGNELWGDQGGLYIRNNYFGCTSKNIFLHASGGSYIQNNSFLGATDSVYADFRMVKVNTSGATVTTTSDYTFGTGLTTGVGVWINGSLYAISSRDSDTQITLTASAGTQSNVDFGIGSAQLQIQDNNFDNVDTSSVRLAGSVKFGSIQFNDNHFNRVDDSTAYNAIWITNENIYEVKVDGNTFINTTSNTNASTGIRATATGYMFTANHNTFSGVDNGIHLTLDGSNDFGLNISNNSFDALNDTDGTAIYVSKAIYGVIDSNQITRFNTGIKIDSASYLLRITNTNMNCSGSTATVISILGGTSNIDINGVSGQSPCAYFVNVGASVTANAVTVSNLSGAADTAAVSFAVAARVDDARGVTFANLPANAGQGSKINCTDCKVVPSTGACQASGNGAIAVRLNSTWVCQVAAGNAPMWEVNGSDVYVSGDNAYGFGTTNPAARMHLAGGSGSNALLIAHGTSGNNLQLLAESTYATLGTYAAADFLFGTNSVNKWRISTTGHFTPEANNQYNIGDPAARILGTYTKYLTVYDTLTLPNGAVNGYVLTTDGSGNASWALSPTSYWSYSAPNIYYSVGNVGIYTSTPVMPLHVVGTQGSPATSGTTPTGTARFVTGNSAMDIGSRANGNTWMQVTDATDLSLEYALELNPNGGDVTITDATSVITLAGSVDMTYAGVNFLTGTLAPVTTNTGSIGDSLLRFATYYGVLGNFSSTLTAAAVDATSTNPYRVNGTTIVDASRNATFVDMTVSGSIIMGSTTLFNSSRNLVGMNGIAQDFIPTVNTNYNIGSSSFKFLNVHSSNMDVYTDFTFNSGATFTGDMIPSFNNTYSIGNSTYGLLKLWTGDIRATGQVTFSNGASNNYLLKTDGSGNASWTNAISINTGTFSGLITANAGISTASGTSSTMYVGSGNFYLRTFSGGDANCSGVTDGWVGYRTDTNELQICDGGATKKVGLL